MYRKVPLPIMDGAGWAAGRCRSLRSADPPDLRRRRIREQLAPLLQFEDADIPEGALDPFIDYVADWLAQRVPDLPAPDAEPGQLDAL